MSSLALVTACGEENPERDIDTDDGVATMQEMEAQQSGNPLPEPLEDEPVAEGIDPDDPRAGDYPKPGEATTRYPIAPGNEEPGGKDMLLPEEREEALEDDAYESPAEMMRGEDEVEPEDPPRL
jgi:hypothetical protein